MRACPEGAYGRPQPADPQREAEAEALGRTAPAAVHPTARIGAGVTLGPFCTIGRDACIGAGSTLHDHVTIGEGCRVGRDCVIRPHAVLYHGVVLGDRCEIHAGAVLGADCYGHAHEGGALPKTGARRTVRIGDAVEIGVNSSVQRGQERDTRIGDHAKLGDLVVVAHDCAIGLRVRLTAQVGLANGVTLRDDVMLMGQVGVNSGVTIGERSVVLAKSGVMSDIPCDSVYFGYPARPRVEALRAMALGRHASRIWQRFLSCGPQQ